MATVISSSAYLPAVLSVVDGNELLRAAVRHADPKRRRRAAGAGGLSVGP